MVRATPRDLVDEPLVLAVDLGGTRMRAALVGPEGAIVHRHEQPTPRDVPCPDALDGLVGHVHGHGHPARAVVGVPGLVDYDLSAHRNGRPATVEQLGSGTALALAASDAGLRLDGAAIVECVRAGDAIATAVWDDAVAAVAAAAANLAHLFTPQAIVLGGGVSRAGDLLLEPVRALVARHGPPLRSDAIAVVTADLGDDAGLVGAAAWPATPADRDVRRRSRGRVPHGRFGRPARGPHPVD